MVDQSLAYDGDGFEAAVRVLREARHGRVVVHAPAPPAGKVLPQVAIGQASAGPQPVVAARVGVVVVDAEQERVDGRGRGKPSGLDVRIGLAGIVGCSAVAGSEA